MRVLSLGEKDVVKFDSRWRGEWDHKTSFHRDMERFAGVMMPDWLRAEVDDPVAAYKAEMKAKRLHFTGSEEL